jgi:hypothetical protein
MSVAVHERSFFSELGIAWARGLTSRSVSIGNYTRFPSRQI